MFEPQKGRYASKESVHFLQNCTIRFGRDVFLRLQLIITCSRFLHGRHAALKHPWPVVGNSTSFSCGSYNYLRKKAFCLGEFKFLRKLLSFRTRMTKVCRSSIKRQPHRQQELPLRTNYLYQISLKPDVLSWGKVRRHHVYCKVKHKL